MSVLDKFETPGYREWDSVELRRNLLNNSLAPEGDGLWVDEPDEVWVMVTPLGLFVGWNDSYVRLPDPPVKRFGDVRHISRGDESELTAAIEEVRKLRLAALIQCRHCGEMTPPGWISDRCCVNCRGDAHETGP
jgi:hypothetical protein